MQNLVNFLKLNNKHYQFLLDLLLLNLKKNFEFLLSNLFFNKFFTILKGKKIDRKFIQKFFSLIEDN